MAEWTLITGASEGLGVEFARLAARDGRKMILSARSVGKLNTLADELRASGSEVAVIPADLNDLDEADRLWAEATDGRRVDFLINNAGLGRNGLFHNDTPDDGGWARELSSINVNVLSLTRLMKRAALHMDSATGGGRILNVSSVAGFMPGPNMAVYHATKAYVLHLSEAVAFEMRKSGVSVTVLCPGATQTQFAETANMRGTRLLKLAPPAKAAAVAAAGWNGALKGRNIVVPGIMNKVFAFLPRIFPRAHTVWFTSIFLSKPSH